MLESLEGATSEPALSTRPTSIRESLTSRPRTLRLPVTVRPVATPTLPDASMLIAEAPSL